MAAPETVRIAAYIAAGICMGIGSLGPALGQGYIGGQACESIGKKPESESSLMKIMFIALAFVESTSIYVFFISLLLVLYIK